LGLQWNFLRNPHESDWSLTDKVGWLRLLGSEITLDDIDSPAFVGRRQRHFDCSVSTLLDFSPQQEGEEAGLTVFMDENHHYEIGVTKFEGKRCVVIRHRVGKPATIIARDEIKNNPLELKIEADRDRYYFSYALNGAKFRALGEGETRYVSTEVAGGFTGVYFAMYATGNGKRSKSPAFFDRFDYDAKEVPKC
jgi:alpha-N-arabinofuranosidase